MRVLLVTDFFDSALGYAEYYLAKKHAESGLDVQVISSNYPVQGENLKPLGQAVEDDVRVTRLKGICRFRGTVLPSNPISLAKVLNDFSPDLVNCRGLFSPLGQEIMLLKARHHFSVVGDVITGVGPGTFFSRMTEGLMTQTIRHFLKRWFTRQVDAFFACNKAVESWLRDSLKLPASKIFLIPLGADHRLFKPDSRERTRTRALLGLSSNDVVAVYSGKLLADKRIPDLLIASKKVVDEFKNFKVVIVGDGPLYRKNESRLLCEKLGLASNVIMMNRVHTKKLRSFYNAADFAVWPGAFSVSIIEAMACGLPVVIAESDWTAHYLEYVNGFSFREGDTSALSSILLRLAKDCQLRKSMGARSRKLVEDKLNWDTISKQYIEVYQSCIRCHYCT